MKKGIACLLTFTLLTPAIEFAHPGGWGPGPVRFLPEAATVVLIGGLTYFLLNGNYHQRHGEESVVAEPPETRCVSEGMRVPDFDGKRFYVQQGHCYQHQMDGDYVDVPRPAG